MSEHHQYVDMYLRKKKGFTGTNAAGVTPLMDDSYPNNNVGGVAANASAAAGGGLDRQMERVVRGTFSVQQFVDRTDALSLQVETFEDKIVNLTKLVKLSQALSDEKEMDLRKQNHELKARLKRQEQISAKMGSDIDALRANLPQLIRETVLTITTPIIEDLQAFGRASHDGLVDQDKKLNQAKEQLSEVILLQCERMMRQELQSLNESSIGNMQQATTRISTQCEQIDKRLEAIETVRISELRRGFEDRIASATQLCRDSTLSEMKGNLHLHLDKIHEEIAQHTSSHEALKLRLGSMERQTSSLDSAFSDFLSTFKEGTRLHAEKTDELANAVKEFTALHDQTRTIVENELESTKQWATRNLHRLKKHIDVLSSDIVALRESHVETSSQLHRVKCHAESEHEKLLSLLQQKSREANILTELVDKEIQSIHTLTTQHRAAPPQPPANANADIPAPFNYTNAVAAATGALDADRKTPRSLSGNLFDELAFTRRPDRRE